MILGLPGVLPTYLHSMLTKVLIFALFAMSLDFVLGYTGLLSLGHGAFFGVSGYFAGILMVHYGVGSFWLVLPGGILMAGLAAVIIGYISLRVTGVYFLLVTLAFGQLLSVGAVKWRKMTGGTDGLVGITYPDLGIAGFTWTAISFYYLVLVAFFICFFLLYRITHSSFGRALVGIRENEPRMQGLGYNTWAHKYIAFIISGQNSIEIIHDKYLSTNFLEFPQYGNSLVLVSLLWGVFRCILLSVLKVMAGIDI